MSTQTKFHSMEIEGKVVPDNYTVIVDGNPVTVKEILTSLRNYESHRIRAVKRMQKRRQKQKEAKVAEDIS